MMRIFKNTKIQDWGLGIIVAFAAIAMFTLGSQILNQYQIGQELTAPITDWITIERFAVESKNGYNTIFFDRAVSKNLKANWTVSAISTESGKTVCSGGGNSSLLTDEEQKHSFSLGFVFNINACEFKVGESYKLSSNFFFTDPKTNLNKALWLDSNSFIFQGK